MLEARREIVIRSRARRNVSFNPANPAIGLTLRRLPDIRARAG